MKKWFLICLFWGVFQQINGQEIPEGFDLNLLEQDSLVDLSRPKIPYFLELGISANAYKGDLGNFQKWTACYHGAIKFNRKQLINSRLGFGFGFITGDNRFYEFAGGAPNNFFRTSLFTLSYELQVNLIKRPNFILYLSQGIGLMRFEVKNELGENLFDQLSSRAENETFANNVIYLPTGIGATYLLKNGYGLGFQASMLNTQTDYLDNISLWGKTQGNDNVLNCKFYIYAPLKIIPAKLFKSKPRQKHLYTHD